MGNIFRFGRNIYILVCSIFELIYFDRTFCKINTQNDRSLK